MTKIDIFSGFLGAGKTTLIKKLIKEAYNGEKLVLIENEFGEIGVDGGFLKEAGIEITEMSQGCICCSLVGDFAAALKQVLTQYNPDRILIEPSGVGKLSDVIAAVKGVDAQIELNSYTTIVDVKKCKMYMKNFGEFFNNQIENANTIILSRTKDAKPEKIKECLDLIKEHNSQAVIVATDWDQLDGTIIKAAMERQNTLFAQLERLAHEHEEDVCPCCGGHHHHEEHHHHDEECGCGHEHHHHHHHDEECGCGHEHHHHHHEEECECGHEHHHHHHDEECECGHEHHHHHHDEECGCGHEHHHHHHDEECECGHEHHHHHHHADEIFQSFGAETAKKFTKEEIENILKAFEDEEKYGVILRAKGIVDSTESGWIHFDYVPEETDIREGGADVIGRICVIGANIKEAAIKELFGV